MEHYCDSLQSTGKLCALSLVLILLNLSGIPDSPLLRLAVSPWRAQLEAFSSEYTGLCPGPRKPHYAPPHYTQFQLTLSEGRQSSMGSDGLKYLWTNLFMWRPQALAERGLGAMGMAWISVIWIKFPVWAFGGRERCRCRFRGP